MRQLIIVFAVAAMGCVGAVGCGSAQTSGGDSAAEPADDAAAPGVKPHYVKCDPAHPEMPCTPDTVPADIEGKGDDDPAAGVKPHYVKCDPARPEMPCTPEPQPTAPPEE